MQDEVIARYTAPCGHARGMYSLIACFFPDMETLLRRVGLLK